MCAAWQRAAASGTHRVSSLLRHIMHNFTNISETHQLGEGGNIISPGGECILKGAFIPTYGDFYDLNACSK